MRSLLILMLVSLICACKKDEIPLDNSVLADYIKLNDSLDLADLIACAGGREGGLANTPMTPTAVFFYPVEGARDFRYFEAENTADSLDFSKFIAKDLSSEPIFNGYLWKFNNTIFEGERLGIITYKTPGKLHVCSPIRQKINLKPTEVNASLGNVLENGVNPEFTWEDGLIDENVIYFQVISDMDGRLISGTYTYEKQFVFYDLSNVVLNITDTTMPPNLEPNQTYKFTMMGVSEDNWVNLLIEKEFFTD